VKCLCVVGVERVSPSETSYRVNYVPIVKNLKEGSMVNTFEEIKEELMKESLDDLLEQVFSGSYIPGPTEDAIRAKVAELESKGDENEVVESLEDRVDDYFERFKVFHLPGKPLAMHFGAFNLVMDLWEEVKKLRLEPGILHGTTCYKVNHSGTGYLHKEMDDTPYDVDGYIYCGRCHMALGPPTKP